MIRVLTGVGFAVLLLLSYAAYPYVTVWQLNQAVTNQDVEALAALVDWESLADGLSADLEGLFDAPDPESNDPMDELAAGLLGLFSDFLIDPIVAFYATPEGLEYLLNTQMILDDPGEVLEVDFPSEDTWYDHIAFAFFAAPATFHVTVNAPGIEPGSLTDEDLMVLEFRMQGFKWQLTRVHLPFEDLAGEPAQK